MSRKAKRQKSIFGNTAILRERCPECGSWSFVLGGIIQCCDVPSCKRGTVRIKRESNPWQYRKLPPKAARKRQLEKQDGRCFYCGLRLDGWTYNGKRDSVIKLKTHWDHFVPWSFDQDNRIINFVAACHICNAIKHNRMFDTIERAREYIIERREQNGWEEYIVTEVPEVPRRVSV